MKQLVISIFVLYTGLVCGQEKTTTDFLSGIKQNNISELWTVKKLNWEFEGSKDSVNRGEPLGYIGDNYQRFFIHFISVIQSSANTLEYYVYGKTKLKSNICSFQGLIKIVESKIYLVRENSYHKQGVIKGEYCFYEDPNNKGSGILKGVFKTNFYIDTNSKIKYNSLGFISDDFNNNQFEGNWTSYKSKESKKCNWGDYRIPDSKELDSGAAEFMPIDKYVKNGWETYMEQISTDKVKADEARRIEEVKWWNINE